MKHIQRNTPYVGNTPLTERDLSVVAQLFGFRNADEIALFAAGQQVKADTGLDVKVATAI